MECTAWTALSKRDLLYGVSLDPELFAHFLEELKARCKAKYNHGPIMTSPKELYRAAIFVLHPDKLRGQKSKFGEHIEEAMTHWNMTARAFKNFGDGLKADVDMKPLAELDDMTDGEYSNERRRVRLACKAKAQTESDFETVKENYRDYRKKAERYMRARDRHLADFQARKTKAEEGRSEQVTKLRKIISNLESRGPCATFEEFKEAYPKAKQTA